jgi:general secretion pathway protein A
MYERFFGLVDAPFRLTPDPRYLFLSKKHAEALAHLRLGLTESSGFVCITGDVGTGKTTLLRAFLAELGPEVATAYIFNPALSALELLRTINREFGLAWSSTSQMDLMDALNEYLVAQRRAGRPSVVVVDEAQALSVDVLEQLRLLSNLETTTEKLLRVVLVGQPQLRALLLNPALTQLNQRITLRWHMGPLAYHETASYVRHRLSVASRGRVTRLFPTPALVLLHRLARGVPRLINMIAHRAMLAAFAAQRRTVTVRSVLRAYREIEVVPLPRTPARRAAWAAIAAVFLGVVAIGAPRFGWWSYLPLPDLHARRPAAQPTRVASITPSAPSVVDTPDASPAPDVALRTPAASAAEEGVPASPAAEVQHRLAAQDMKASSRAAIEAVLAAWRMRPLGADEKGLPGDIEKIAWRRGLEDLAFNGNDSMLRLLDLPAVIELRLPDATEPRYAALTGMSDRGIVLTVDGKPTLVDSGFLDRYWFGQAHVTWRDFEGLGPTFGQEARGVPVARLQTLLHRAGAYDGNATGEYDPATARAVLDFQRSRLLVADGRVGRLTRIVLYGAAGGYPRPTLASGGTS